MAKTAKWLGLVSQKGGTGKSTLTVHLAVEAQRAGEDVVVLDADPQGSTLAWSASRTAEQPRVERMPERTYELRLNGESLVVVDFPPRASAAVTLLAERLDFALVPVQPSAFDLATVSTSTRILRAAKIPFAIVVNRAPARSIEVGEVQEALAEMDVSVAPVTIGDRRAFVRALSSGVAVVEFEPRGRAAEEVALLWAFVKENLP